MAFVISACFCCIFRLKSLIFIIFFGVLFGNSLKMITFVAASMRS